MIKAASLGKEICITVVNKIGVLADISKVLAQAGINIEAVAGYAKENSQEAQIILITSDNQQAAEALKKENYTSVAQEEVVVLELENEPGALKEITTRLSAAGIDIKYIYGTTCAANCPAKLVLSTSDNQKALEAFKK
jgi:hypothetical protein